LTDLHEILAAIIRSMLVDEALANDLKGRIQEMQERKERLEDRASKRRQVARDVMIEMGIKKLPDERKRQRPCASAVLPPFPRIAGPKSPLQNGRIKRALRPRFTR
jgi:hypothetical protein